MSGNDIHNLHPETSASISTPAAILPRTAVDAVRAYAADANAGLRLDREARGALLQKLRRTPDGMVEDLCKVLDETDGHALGLTVDTSAVRLALQEHRMRRLLVAKIRDVARRIEDEGLRRKAEALDPALAAYRVLLAVENVPEGAAFKDALEVVKASRKAGRRKHAKTPNENPITGPKA